MKTTIFTLAFICATYFVNGQQGTVNIEQDEKIEALLEIYKSASQTAYYTIQVGFVSVDQKAYDLEALVNIDFPNLSSRVEFDSPTFRVKVGKFKTKLEGERKLKEVRRKYPQAMLLKPKKSSK